MLRVTLKNGRSLELPMVERTGKYVTEDGKPAIVCYGRDGQELCLFRLSRIRRFVLADPKGWSGEESSRAA